MERSLSRAQLWSHACGIMLIKNFFKLPFKEKTMLVEALCWLILARLALLIFPFRKIAPRLGIHMKEDPGNIPPPPAGMLPQIRRAIGRAGRCTPWESKCLAQAMAGKKMLRKRGISSTLYLGVANDEGSEEKMKAHAWLMCGEIFVTGKEGFEGYTVVSTFREENS